MGFYGAGPGFRADLEHSGIGYVLAVGYDQRVHVNDGRALVRVDDLADRTPLPTPVGVLVGLRRDGRGDSATAQVTAVGPRRVRLVGKDPIRSGPGTAGAHPRNPNSVQDRDELRTVPTLTSRQHHCQGLLPLLTRQVQLRGQPTTRATQGMVVRLDADAAGRLGLQIPLFRAPAAC